VQLLDPGPGRLQHGHLQHFPGLAGAVNRLPRKRSLEVHGGVRGSHFAEVRDRVLLQLAELHQPVQFERTQREPGQRAEFVCGCPEDDDVFSGVPHGEALGGAPVPGRKRHGGLDRGRQHGAE